MSGETAVRLRVLAGDVLTGALALPITASDPTVEGLGDTALRTLIVELAQHLPRGPLAAALRRMADVLDAHAGPQARLVLTDTFDDVHGHDSLVAMRDLAGVAERRLTLCGYSWGHWTEKGEAAGHPLFEDVWKRMRTTPDLKVRLLLHLRRNGGGDEHDAIERWRRWFWQRLWPWPERPEVFFDAPTASGDADQGILHAKFAVADGSRLLVTSANLSEAAIHRNVEVGVLLDNHALATKLERQVDLWIKRGVLVSERSPR